MQQVKLRLVRIERGIVKVLRRSRIVYRRLRARCRGERPADVEDAAHRSAEEEHEMHAVDLGPRAAAQATDTDEHSRCWFRVYSRIQLPSSWRSSADDKDAMLVDIARIIMLLSAVLMIWATLFVAVPCVVSLLSSAVSEDGSGARLAPDGSTDNWSWYHAHPAIKQFGSAQEAGQDAAIQEMCHPLTLQALEQNKTECPLSTNVDSQFYDMTLLHHMMCHVAHKHAARNPDDVTIVSPKMLNVSHFKMTVNDPQKMADAETVASHVPPNVCIFALILPARQSDGEQHQHSHAAHWPYEARMRGLPRGAFIHTSRQKRAAGVSRWGEDDIDSFYYEDASPGGAMWADRPTPGKCAIIANPVIEDASEADSTEVGILHTSPMLGPPDGEDEPLFFSKIRSSAALRYTQLAPKETPDAERTMVERVWNFANERDSMQVQLAVATLYGKWRPARSAELARTHAAAG